MAQEYRDPRLKDGRVFSQVNKMFITLNDVDMKGYNEHFQKILNKLTDMMKSQDPFFQATFQEIVYAGSYYDGLKVGKPEEFDLDLIIKLPVDYSKIEFHEEQDRPGYLKLKMNAILPDLRKHPRWSECYKVMDDWVDNDSYLNQSKFRQWMEGVVSRALHGLESAGNGGFVLLDKTDRTDDVPTRYVLSTKKSGPAFTLCILEPSGKKIDVDLVPVLEFKTPPPPSFRKLNGVESYWLAVPKPLEGEKSNLFWRLSFYKQERKVLDGPTKPVIRQMKKLRDNLNYKSIASYYIKTLFLWELEERKIAGDIDEFLKTPPNSLFFYMLKKLHKACCDTENGIKDYWYQKNNLLIKIKNAELMNIQNRLNNIIKEIERKCEWDPYIIAHYVLTREELLMLKEELPLPVKQPSTAGGPPTSNMVQQMGNLSIQGPSANLQRSMSTQSAPGAISTNTAVGPTDINSKLLSMLTEMNGEIVLTRTMMKELTEKIDNLEGMVNDLKTENQELRALLDPNIFSCVHRANYNSFGSAKL